MDERLRDLQRRAQQGDLEAQAALAAARRRVRPPRGPRQPRKAPLFYVPFHPVPSVNTLQRISASGPTGHIDRQTALLLRRVLDGRLDPETLQIPEYRYGGGAFHRNRLILEAANQILDAHGVEAIALDTDSGTEYTDYVNLGDTYATTLCLSPEGRFSEGRFFVACWGDVVERHEREHGEADRGW